MAEKKKLAVGEGKQRSFPYRSMTGPTQHMVVVLLDDKEEPGQIIEERGVKYERVDHIEIDVKQIPDHVRDSLAEATLRAYKNFIKIPGNREKLDKRIAEKGTQRG